MRDVEWQNLGVDHTLDEVQPLKHKLIAIIHDKDTPHVQLGVVGRDHGEARMARHGIRVDLPWPPRLWLPVASSPQPWPSPQFCSPGFWSYPRRSLRTLSETPPRITSAGKGAMACTK